MSLCNAGTSCLEICRYDCGIGEILLRDKPDAFLAASKSATVPVLELRDGRVIEESLDIMFWALQEAGDPAGWLSVGLC